MSTDGCQPHESVILDLGIGSTLVLKIGAECSNPARSDLCGEPGETSVPTATGGHPAEVLPGQFVRDVWVGARGAAEGGAAVLPYPYARTPWTIGFGVRILSRI
jgi:hypothetical protein